LKQPKHIWSAHERSTDKVDLEWKRLAHSVGFRPKKLAEVAGVSLRTLERHFRSRYGVTVSGWLASIRLREASERIRAGSRVKEVALDLGYKQLSHFSREFKRAYGSPPSSMSPSRSDN